MANSVWLLAVLVCRMGVDAAPVTKPQMDADGDKLCALQVSSRKTDCTGTGSLTVPMCFAHFGVGDAAVMWFLSTGNVSFKVKIGVVEAAALGASFTQNLEGELIIEELPSSFRRRSHF